MKVFMMPTPEEASNDTTNAINQVVLKLQKHLPQFGVEIVSDRSSADIIAGHAGLEGGRGDVDVSHCHGLYPTSMPGSDAWHWAANRAVIANLMSAKQITVPSEWVADILRRDMHVDPHVIGWAIEPEMWPLGQPGGYVLWNKTRSDNVCDPSPIISLAAQMPRMRFTSTFGKPSSNLQIIGRQPYERMREIVRSASIYLATTKETFGIATLEAMCSGVPVVGYRWGGTADIVKHGVTGYLVEPGDIQGLAKGIEWSLTHRGVLGLNARLVASEYTWDKVAWKMAAVYNAASLPHQGPRVSVIIPCYNYERYVGEAIKSVLAQKTEYDFELIVVDDGSTDGSASEIAGILGVPVEGGSGRGGSVRFMRKENGGVAEARNAGIRAARGEFIVCLDADDVLGDTSFIQTLASSLAGSRSLGVAFSALRMMQEDGTLAPSAAGWPNGYDYDAQLQRHNQIPTCCMFRKEAWRRAGGYDKLFQPVEDARLWTIMGSLGFKAEQVTTAPMFHYRLHSKSLTASIRSGHNKEPDWLYGLPFVTDGKRPFASDGKPKVHSWPVRNYDQPLVSVIIPVGPGHETLVLDALRSLESQTERMWEAIVVNDTGKTLSVSPYVWARIIDTKGHMGAGHARNLGVSHARAQSITFLDADDALLPDFLRRTLPMQKSLDRYIYTDWLSLNKEGVIETHTTPEFDVSFVFKKQSLHSVNVVMSRSWFEKSGGFDEQMTSWEDVDFFMKLASMGYCGTRVPEPLMIYRYQTGSRRESGEPYQDGIKAFLRDRYSDFIVGGKVPMCCGEPPKPKNGKPELSAESLVTGEAIRVQYAGERVPKARASLIGSATKQRYGRRAYGDVFIVWAQDYNSMKDVLHPVSMTLSLPDNTPEPVAPEFIPGATSA